MSYLQEHLTYDQAKMITETDENSKNMYMKGIMIQGDVKNANHRIYPVNEISSAVNQIMEQINKGSTILGELDHPDDLKVNLANASHIIETMWMEGSNGYGKLKILKTPAGNIVKTMLESGVKLGVSSRGSGNVNESSGSVSDFEIVTVDIVATPSAPEAYPTAVFEAINYKNNGELHEISRESLINPKVQKHLENGVVQLIRELGLKTR